MDDDDKLSPNHLRDAFESELAVRREAAEEARRKGNLWIYGAGMACGHFASFVPRLLMDPEARPFLFAEQKWEVLALLGGIALVVLLGSLALYLRDRSWTVLRDFSLSGLAVAALLVLLR